MWQHVTENPSTSEVSELEGEDRILKSDSPTDRRLIEVKNMGRIAAGVDGDSDSDTSASMDRLKAETVFVTAWGDEGVCNTCLQK